MSRTFDVVVVGSGAAGSILAERLSADASTSVLVIEAGVRRRTPLLSVPAAETWLIDNPKYDWCFRTEPDDTLGGRGVSMPRGRVLGGSTAINGMIFVRGAAEDYDAWARQGCAGWGWDDVHPIFRRLETSEVPGSTRGTSGQIKVGEPRSRHELADAFIRAGISLGYPANPDYNAGHQTGFGYYQVNHERGRRSAPSNTYLERARQRPNVTVETGTLVTRVLFQGDRAIGVETIGAAGVETISCREVVLAAGVIQSPRILESSGVGDPAVLARANVRVRWALPGVGENLQDHYAARLRWRVSNTKTFNEASRGLRLAREVGTYLATRRGLLSVPIALAYGFVPAGAPRGRADLQFHFSPASYGEGSARRLDRQPGMTVGVYSLRPRSRGSVHITSSDPNEHPSVNTNFLAERGDLDELIAGVRIARELIATDAFAPYSPREVLPGIGVASDSDVARFVTDRGDTSYHPVGTCRMGVDDTSVVGPDLRVHGIEGLRVIDASIMPTMVSGNTNAAAMMIAEKGADLMLDRESPNPLGVCATEQSRRDLASDD